MEESDAPVYSKKREGVSEVDPKVFEPYVPIPGRAPRKVVIERKKKLFESLNIETMLNEAGIDYSRHIPAWLPLEPFDNYSYNERLPSEWIDHCEMGEA